MAGTKPTVYRDACVFVAFLKGDPPAELMKEGVKSWSDRERSSPGGFRPQDAIHVATATLYDCIGFHTFDGQGEDKGPCLKLLKLNGMIPGFTIPIRPPYRPGREQPKSFDTVKETKQADIFGEK